MSEVQYQTFPGLPGDSNSLAKLSSLALPPLAGKSFLDIGCNEGFFCGFAFFEAAKSVLGVDRESVFIERARKHFPQCAFETADWTEFFLALPPNKKFDVILCASALHYADDQEKLFSAMMDRLTPKGVLVLEIGVVAAGASEITASPREGWAEVARIQDKKVFPTQSGLEKMFFPYVWKYMGPGVPQKGDPVPRRVYHVKKPMPCAILMLGESGSGKTTIAKRLFPNIRLISGDNLWAHVLKNGADSPALKSLIQGSCNWQRLDILYRKMFEGSSWKEFVALVINESRYDDFVFDGYIPDFGRKAFILSLEEHGFMVLPVETPKNEFSPYFLSRNARLESRKYGMFLSAWLGLQKRHPINR